MAENRCPGSGKPPIRVLRAAQRVLLGNRVSVHPGRAICVVCSAEVGLNVTGRTAKHPTGKVPAPEIPESPISNPPKRPERSVATIPTVGDVVDPTNREDLRRWIEMLPRGQAALLERDKALRLV